MEQKNYNPSVTKFLDDKNHPNRELIETLEISFYPPTNP